MIHWYGIPLLLAMIVLWISIIECRFMKSFLSYRLFVGVNMITQLFHVVITDQPLDIIAAQQFVMHSAFGAISSFVGVVRDTNEGRIVEAITYDVHETLALKVLHDVCHEALKKTRCPAKTYV